MATILAKKSQNETPIATDDEAQAQLIADPSVPQFSNNQNVNGPQQYGGSQYGYGGSQYGGGNSNQVSSYGSTTNINQSNSSVPVLTGAAPTNAASDADVLVKADEHWVNAKWRPMMGWLYMVTCAVDFIVFPILWSILQAVSKGSVTTEWQPLTLQGAGLFHIAMGSVLGIAAYGRTKEKLENKQ